MNLSDHYQQHPDCLLEDMDGEVLLFNPSSATTLHLNGPSALVWQLCTGEHSLGVIVGSLKQHYPEQADQIENDVLAAVKELLASGVLQKAEAVV